MKDLLEKKYRVKVEEPVAIGDYQCFRSGNYIYLIFDASRLGNEELDELGRIAEHLYNQGDRRVLRFMQSSEGTMRSEWEGSQYCVLATNTPNESRKSHIGRKLAKFHGRGRSISFQIKAINRIGQWKKFWETRLDQMEKVWNEKLHLQPENDFERMFIESFPYYMGLSENAIQYLVDTELDDTPTSIDSGTVCHERFTAKSWRSQFVLKNPFEWVFDHSSRDLAEWVRDRYLKNIKTYEPEVREFFTDYQGYSQLSSFSCRLLYARILFPLHYFECIENYYISQSENDRHWHEDKLKKYLSQSADYESFVGDFFQIAHIPVRTMKIPQVEWLMRRV